MFKRAWLLKYKKRPSISGYIVEDKNAFDINWTENAVIKASKAEERKRKLKSRSNWMRRQSSRADLSRDVSSSLLQTNSINMSSKQSQETLERIGSQMRLASNRATTTPPTDEQAQGPSPRKIKRTDQHTIKLLKPNLLVHEGKVDDEALSDPEFDQKGPGTLNPFKRYQKRSDEEVKLSLVR